MINLKADARMTKWFVWCCDHLPMTVTRDYSENKREGVRRTGAHYLEKGTTLCHVFWASLWVPITVTALISFVVAVFGMVHVVTYREQSAHLGVAAFFLPEIVAIGAAVICGIILLVVIGADKSGFSRLLWAYLSGVKSRICPLVKFEPAP